MRQVIKRSTFFKGLLLITTLTAVSFGIRGLSFFRALPFPFSQTGPRIPAEFAPTTHVLVTDLLLRDYDNPQLIEKIIDTGSRVLMLSALMAPGPESRQWLKDHGLTEKQIDAIDVIQAPYDTPWVRDYGPLTVYNSSQSSGNSSFFVDFVYKVQSELDDAIPGAIAHQFNVPVIKSPMAVDGGNFLTNGDRCFMASPWRDLPEDATQRAAMIARQEQELKMFYQSLGCGELVFFDNPPHPHIDMWAKIVSPDVVLVSELQQRTLDAIPSYDGYIPEEFIALKQNLDEQAARFAMYMKVVRIPMPLPYRGTFRNYTNALLINGKAIVPDFVKLGYNYDRYPDESLHEYYQKEVYQAYSEAGFQVDWFDADTLIYNGGAAHCVALQLALPDQKNLRLGLSSSPREH